MVQQYAVYLEEKIFFVRDFQYEYGQEDAKEPSRCSAPELPRSKALALACSATALAAHCLGRLPKSSHQIPAKSAPCMRTSNKIVSM